MKSIFQCGRFALPLTRPLVMGVLNITPDSFSDGGLYPDVDAAIARALKLKEEGADLLDIGGESTRPGAAEVTVEEELRRVLPILKALDGVGIPLSVDTRKPAVMAAAIEQGVDMINDVSGFATTAAQQIVAQASCGLCIMHMRGEPSTMQSLAHYSDVVREVKQALSERLDQLLARGVSAARICVDPGFGFGKNVHHNYILLRHLDSLLSLEQPILVGLSRKSMIGIVTNRSVEARVSGSVAAALGAVARGARILRVHDVAATRDALAVWDAIEHGVKE